MNIFISQTKGKSREVAEVLQVWLRDEMRLGDPWMSEDILGGDDWRKELKKALKQARCGIICITDDNLMNQWIILEAGVLDINGIKVIPYVLDPKKSGDLPSPINHLQGKSADEEGTKNLVIAINKALGNPVAEPILRKTFKSNWKKLNRELERIRRPPVDDIEKVVGDFVKIFMDVNRYRMSLDFSPMVNTAIKSYINRKKYEREIIIERVYEVIDKSREPFKRKSILIGNVSEFFKEHFTEDNLRQIIIRLEPILFSKTPRNIKRDQLLRRIKIEELEVYLHFHQILVDMLRARIVVK